MSGLNSQDL